jgi:Tfp pilus assembly protein FimT
MIRTRPDGFSLIDVMLVAGLVAVLGGLSVPAISAGMRRYSLISASQQVVSTIRMARAQAVAKNVTLRVRFNCPEDGLYRIVEVTGDAGIDDSGNRCHVAAYPFPAADSDSLTLPNLDGAVQFLPDGADFGEVRDLEFNPSGRVTFLPAAAVATIVVTNGDDGQNRTITVSASGRIQLP